MKHRLFLFAILAALATGASGCTAPPKDAEGFRKLAINGTMWLNVEKFEVDRSYLEVARTFERRSRACLRVRVTTSYSRGGASRQDYHPRVNVDRKRAEFYIQVQRQGGGIKLYSEAPGGDYLMVTDAYPIGRKKTRIELHRPGIGYDALIKAVRRWAIGKNLGCPDLTK